MRKMTHTLIPEGSVRFEDLFSSVQLTPMSSPPTEAPHTAFRFEQSMHTWSPTKRGIWEKHSTPIGRYLFVTPTVHVGDAPQHVWVEPTERLYLALLPFALPRNEDCISHKLLQWPDGRWPLYTEATTRANSGCLVTVFTRIPEELCPGQ